MKTQEKNTIRSTVQRIRAMLMQETREQLEGIYGLNKTGQLDNVDHLPEVLQDRGKQDAMYLLQDYLDEEVRAGLDRLEAVEKIIKETAFTHLNRLVAFKMMEARGIIRGTIDRGIESNGFKFYLAETPQELGRYNDGDAETAYKSFILWQCRQIAAKDHLQVLFDADNLHSRLFPRFQILKQVIELLNAEALNSIWPQDETIGWVYQYFIEEDKDAVFHKIYKEKQKMALRDIPKATQIFTPRWIVEYLVHNTLGRLWLRMHPDSTLREQMKYYVPNPSTDEGRLPLKPVREITLLDPACGTMHFGLVAFDLFYEMYREEKQHTGQPGWPAADQVIVKEEDIPQAIVENNIYGIDIDLRAIQLSALSLYLKVKSRNKNARIDKLNLTYTDVPPVPANERDVFIDSLHLKHAIAKELLRDILPELDKAYYLGSLLKIEERIRPFLDARRQEIDKYPLLAAEDAGLVYSQNTSLFWVEIRDEIIEGLRAAVAQRTSGQSLMAGETMQGLGLIDALLKKYDVVVTNPPYAGRRNITDTLAKELKDQYPLNYSDLYSVFIQRNDDLLAIAGFLGMITQQTFMFTSSFAELRKYLLENYTIQTMQQFGSKAFEGMGGDKISTCTFILEKRLPTNLVKGVYFRLTDERWDEKRIAFEKALSDFNYNSIEATDRHLFVLRQEDFKAIPGWPLVYWVSDQIRKKFITKLLSEVAHPAAGLQTGDNVWFLREWWETGRKAVHIGCRSNEEAKKSDKRWFPYMKGGEVQRWYGNIEYVLNWQHDGKELDAFRPKSVIRNYSYYFQEGTTYSFLTTSSFSVRYLPLGFIFDVIGSSIFTNKTSVLFLLPLLNSKMVTYLLSLLNPTAAFQVGDIARIPYPNVDKSALLVQAVEKKAQTCIHLKRMCVQTSPTSWEFIEPLFWNTFKEAALFIERSLTRLESDINEMVYELYNVASEDIDLIEDEFGRLANHLPKEKPNASVLKNIQNFYLNKHIPEQALKSRGNAVDEDQEEPNESRRQARYLNFEEICLASGYHPDTVYEVITQNGWERPEERFALALDCLEYALGVLMGRFVPGVKGELGCAIIHKNDFITGSLTISNEEFAEITQYFPVTYTDEHGKHAFAKAVEEQLQSLADPDGIMVLDEGHEDDLPAKIEDTLVLMLGEKEAHKVLATLVGESAQNREKFRRFLERDFFSKHHLKMYKKRPIYWLLQTEKKSYSFYIFHERFDHDTLFKLQRHYIDPKLKHIDQQIRDISKQLSALEGRDYREKQAQQEKLEELYQEVKEFADKVTAVLNLTDENGKVVGYDPDINDGVIINLAPLRHLVPWNEPAQYWQELEKGKYDWAHLAMRYWPGRVRGKCKSDKSLAIAHDV